MDNEIGVVFDEEGRLILSMKLAMRDFLLEVLPRAVVEGSVARIDLTALASESEKFGITEDSRRLILAFARIDDFPCQYIITPLADLGRVRKSRE